MKKLSAAKYQLLISAPVNGRIGKATFRFVAQKEGKTVHADKAAVESEEDRSRLIRRAAKKLKVPEARLRRQVEDECNRFLDAARDQQERAAAGEPPGEAEQDERLSAATMLVRLVEQAGVELFHTPDGTAFARVPADDHREVWPLRQSGFRRWIKRLYYQASGKAPGSQSVEDALGVLEGRASFDGRECAVEVRIAGQGASTYLDLADPEWHAVEITPRGWSTTAEPPAYFRRPKGLLALPTPTRGGRLDELRRFVNLDSEGCYQLVIAWMLAALRPRGPYPVLCLYGQQGSAKSTAARVLRQLIDPNAAPLRTEPKEARDLMIAASNCWCVCFDNLSTIPGWLSDALCCLATGGGFSTRQLYTDGEETIFNAMRPVILTSIEDVATRGDLLDRAILLNLPSIPENKRRPERDFWADWKSAQPRLLGALLDAATAVARELPGVRLTQMPRMADFAEVGVAAERALGWGIGAFLDAYRGNRDTANESALEASPVAAAVQRFMSDKEEWSGPSRDLLAELTTLIGDRAAKDRDWPRKANVLTGRLKRVAPNLRAVGLRVDFTRDKRARGICLTNERAEEERRRDCASPASPASPAHENKGFPGDDAGDDAGPGDDAGDAGDERVTKPPRRKAHKNRAGDAGDADDAESRPCSEWEPDEPGYTPF